MIKTDPNLIKTLETDALWLVVHPVNTFDDQIHEIYPWLRAETINFSKRIDHYLENVKYKAISAPTPALSLFNQYANLSSCTELSNYLNRRKLSNIVYCGFHYGFCILNDPEVGVKIMKKYYNCFVKKDICQLAWEADWNDRDTATRLHAKII
jgi:hypothetical protein